MLRTFAPTMPRRLSAGWTRLKNPTIGSWTYLGLTLQECGACISTDRLMRFALERCNCFKSSLPDATAILCRGPATACIKTQTPRLDGIQNVFLRCPDRRRRTCGIVVRLGAALVRLACCRSGQIDISARQS